MMTSTYTTIEFAIESAVAVVRLNRPEKLNALNWVMAGDFLDMLPRLEEARALVITGSEKAFSAGYDLSQTREEIEKGSSLLEAYDGIAALPIPTIAAIEGYCLGGGLELALCCDLRIASETARIGTPEVLRGILPGGGGTQRLPRLIGPSRAKEMMFSGDHFSAETAERWGLVNRVVPAGQALHEAVELAKRLAVGAPLAIREIKFLVDSGTALDLADALDLERQRGQWLGETEDAQEGIQAFLERRPPDFKGR